MTVKRPPTQRNAGETTPRRYGGLAHSVKGRGPHKEALYGSSFGRTHDRVGSWRRLCRRRWQPVTSADGVDIGRIVVPGADSQHSLRISQLSHLPRYPVHRPVFHKDVVMAEGSRKPTQTYASLAGLRALVERGHLRCANPKAAATYRTGGAQTDPEGLLLVFADGEGEPEYFCFLPLALVNLLHDAFAIELARRHYLTEN